MVSRETCPPPVVAGTVFGDRLPAAHRYAEELATTGVEWGLIGPRETARLWTRHIVNCAVIEEVIPQGASVIDVGSGAGLPGIPLALARPDLEVLLVEPMERRVRWLERIIPQLGVPVRVLRARAEETTEQADVVTSRALAPIGKLLDWSLPLVRPGGRVVAVKGRSVQDELRKYRHQLTELGNPVIEVCCCGTGILDEPATVVTAYPRAGRPRRSGP
ncbi:MAG: 16S rRNA (guanine(527)-N(7))-methyltransferase RsmG [Micrococcales bacterium]|nr:MAG: 16S rRNA (guanine(527)-N(7))-methyltransferase RsmG [Micrococcales bacterium]PIE27021.1 MAG: 16S rRNA (guanine(527)-N(7))-methyltransferase RsmG [Micrococcales bacterium]